MSITKEAIPLKKVDKVYGMWYLFYAKKFQIIFLSLLLEINIK